MIKRIKMSKMAQCFLSTAVIVLSLWKTGHSLGFGDAAAAVWVIAAKYVRGEGGSVLVGQAGRLASRRLLPQAGRAQQSRACCRAVEQSKAE